MKVDGGSLMIPSRPGRTKYQSITENEETGSENVGSNNYQAYIQLLIDSTVTAKFLL